MKNIMILIAVIAMSVLSVQANETQPIQITVSSADAASAPTESSAPEAEEDTNTTRDEEKS